MGSTRKSCCGWLTEAVLGKRCTNNGLVRAAILVDGFVAGTWQLERGRVRLEPFGRLDAAVRKALREEVARVEAFAA